MKIGDFGLSVQTYISDKALGGDDTNADLSRSVGTTLYVAPELRSNVSAQYNEKVDVSLALFSTMHRMILVFSYEQADTSTDVFLRHHLFRDVLST